MNLYHFSHIRNLIPIIEEKKLKPGDNFEYGHNHTTFKKMRGNVVSLTRNFNFKGAGMVRDFCLVLDKDILKRNYKLIPYNDYPGSTYRTHEREEIIILKSKESYVDISKALKEIIIFDGYLDRGMASILDQIKYYISQYSKVDEKYITKEYAEKFYSKMAGVPVRIIQKNNFNVSKKKYIKTFESYESNKELDSAVYLFMKVVEFIENNFKFYKDHYESKDFSYMIKPQIILDDIEVEGDDSYHPLTYSSIHSTDFQNEEDVRELLYLKKNSTYRMLWDIETLELSKMIFDINIGTNKDYRLERLDVMGDEDIDRYKSMLDKQKSLLEELKNIPQKNITESGYHFPNFWVHYQFGLDVKKKSENIIKSINKD